MSCSVCCADKTPGTDCQINTSCSVTLSRWLWWLRALTTCALKPLLLPLLLLLQLLLDSWSQRPAERSCFVGLTWPTQIFTVLMLGLLCTRRALNLKHNKSLVNGQVLVMMCYKNNHWWFCWQQTLYYTALDHPMDVNCISHVVTLTTHGSQTVLKLIG